MCAGIIIEEIARGDLSMAYTQLLGSLSNLHKCLWARHRPDLGEIES